MIQKDQFIKKIKDNKKQIAFALIIIAVLTVPLVWYMVIYPDGYILDSFRDDKYTWGDQETNPYYNGYNYDVYLTSVYRDCYKDEIDGSSWHVFSTEQLGPNGQVTREKVRIKVYEEDIYPGAEMEFRKAGAYTYGYPSPCDGFMFE